MPKIVPESYCCAAGEYEYSSKQPWILMVVVLRKQKEGRSWFSPVLVVVVETGKTLLSATNTPGTSIAA